VNRRTGAIVTNEELFRFVRFDLFDWIGIVDNVDTQTALLARPDASALFLSICSQH